MYKTLRAWAHSTALGRHLSCLPESLLTGTSKCGIGLTRSLLKIASFCSFNTGRNELCCICICVRSPHSHSYLEGLFTWRCGLQTAGSHCLHTQKSADILKNLPREIFFFFFLFYLFPGSKVDNLSPPAKTFL